MSTYENIMTARCGDVLAGDYGRDASDRLERLMEIATDASVAEIIARLGDLSREAAVAAADLKLAMNDRSVDLSAVNPGRPVASGPYEGKVY